VLFKQFPRASAVVRAIESAAPTAAGKTPGRAPRLPQRREKNVRVAGIERDIDSARVLVFVQDLFPSLASVGGTKDPPLGVWAERMAQRRDIGDVGVLGIDNHFP